MDLRLQPKPEVEFLPVDRGIVSRKQFFVKKKFEQINQYFFPGLLIRDWRPKAELLYPPQPEGAANQYECDFNREVQNCFVEDYAEEVFLRTPPPCFVVFGKFKRDVNALCQKLAEEFGSVLIQADDIVYQVLKRDTGTSRILDRILRLGVSLTLNFILALLSYVAHTAEARHRGYVLSGLPCLPLSYDLPVEQQFNYLFTWDNKPTVFINLLFNDEDLIRDRTHMRVEVKDSGNGKFFDYWLEDLAEEEDESDGDDDMLPIKEETPPHEQNINVLPSRPRVQLPRDEESRVWYELELFDNIAKPVIELIHSRVDPQYFITLDSRVDNEFEVVTARLKLLQIWKAPVARPFLPPKAVDELKAEAEEEEELEESEEIMSDNEFTLRRIAEEPPQTAFLTLFTKQTISPKFRWELSHYNYICPVSLREGEVVEGKTEFAVTFMKYIYFLRDAESMAKFIQNPRPYVLPIRPKPLCRFVILGHPFSGKTSVAKALSMEFSIPLIDVRTILKDDLERKKDTYREFCRQKAECREMIRLTALAWKDWRKEEERRISLIEQWILFVQTLLSRRIEQFYSAGSDEETPTEISSRGYALAESNENIQMEAEGSIRPRESGRRPEGKKNLARGTPNGMLSGGKHSMPSKELIQAIKEENFDFNKNSFETEANSFFTSLWRDFSGVERSAGMAQQHPIGEFGEDGDFEIDLSESDDYYEKAVNWCTLLPPQSLSSFLMSKEPYTAREKRQSFKYFLDAASKVYWEPSALKSQFVKWRLPCFMDIPLCERFLDNPSLLLRYLPEWLKERPLFPDPVDPTHPSVVEASRKAFVRSQIIDIKHSEEEIGILLHHAIEKAEREGMRVTGEVMSPGGWVVDNMGLNMDVWNKLACENVFPDHIYVLVDTEPDLRRIITTWWENCGIQLSSEFLLASKSPSKAGEEQNFTPQKTRKSMEISEMSETELDESKSIIRLLIDNLKEIEEGNKDLDEFYNSLLEDEQLPQYFLPVLMTEFGPSSTDNLVKQASTFKKGFNDDSISVQSWAEMFVCTVGLSDSSKPYPAAWNVALGTPLEIVTSKLLNYFEKKPEEDVRKVRCKQYLESRLQFFLRLLSFPKKVEELKNWLASLNREGTIKEIDITGKTPESVFLEIRNSVMAPFIKKPRELENFEVEEIKKSTENEPQETLIEDEFEDESYEVDISEEEDLRIFGESGQLCIVNLERDIFLLGKPEHALRYYGKLYYFWDQDSKNKFIEDPEKYAPYYSAIRCYPPLRIFVTGPIGSGKTTLARLLSEQCGIPVVEYSALLSESLVPHSEFSDLTALTDQKLLLSEDHNAAAKKAVELFSKAPYNNRQFWTENYLFSDYLDKETVLTKIMEVQQPVEFQNFPELTYSTLHWTPGEEMLSDEHSESSPEADVPLDLLKPPYANMKELETLIRSYLKNGTDLNDYCIERSLKTLWTQEPFIRQGFVLESFPLRSYDTKAIIENNWIPDLILELVVPENEVIERSIDSLMELWEAKLKQETTEEKLLEDTLNSIHKTWMMIKRDELLEERRSEGLGSEDNGAEEYGEFTQSHTKTQYLSDVSGSESQYTHLEDVNTNMEAEVNEVLSKEFPQLEFNPNFETYEAGKARIIENITEMYRRDVGEIEKIKAILKERHILWLEIDGLKNFTETMAELFRRLDVIRKRLIYKGEFAFTLTMKRAEELLDQGYYFLSKFGRWCPVQVYRMKNPIHMFRPLSARGKVTPIAYRNYIYFVAGENEKKQFLDDPIKYTFNQPHHPNIPLRVAVIGPPKSGKTTLSTRLGLMFDLKVITMGSALRFALEKTPGSTLAKSINNYLKRGCFLPLSLKVEALILSLNDPSCFTQGFVFDGIPFDAALTQSLAEKGKLPFVIISLVADSHFGKAMRETLNLKELRLPYKNRVNLDKRYQDWMDKYKRFAQWNQDTYNNLYEVNAKSNVVDIFYQAYDIIRKSFFAILYYVEYCVSGRVLPLRYLCVSQNEYESRKSALHNNCPVCWAEKKRLCSSYDPPPRSGLVQYGKHFYWICPEHLEKFVKNPKIYFFPHAPKWPEILPKRLNFRSFEITSEVKIHGYGRCPVTRIDFPSSLDWEGSWNFAAFYAGEVFLCKNEEMLDRFLSEPWRYCQADTQFEVNRKNKSIAVESLGPPEITSLPPIGFLEQTVANIIHKALQLLGTVRPVYPNMNPSVTGCIFVALYLKVHNRRNKTPHLERQYLDFMLRHCKAFTFKVSCVRPEKRIGQGDCESLVSDESDESDAPCPQSGARNYDFYPRNDKKMWSAKKISDKYLEMKLSAEDELMEIPEHPKVITVLRFESINLRTDPIPPLSNCLNFIYSVSPPVEVSEKFNYNTLYQQSSLSSPSFTPGIMFNPHKVFAMSLYHGDMSSFPSSPNIYVGQRAVSDTTLESVRQKTDEDFDIRYIRERFIPRFQLFDKMCPVKVPPTPKVAQEAPLVYNPRREYAYTMLLSEFFRTTHVLRCYEWKESCQHLEFANRLDHNLGLTPVQVEYIFRPRKTVSERSRTSLDSYQQIFDAATLFVVGGPEMERRDSSFEQKKPSPKSSTYNFIESLLFEKLDQLFEHVFYNNLSYDAFEIDVAPEAGKERIVVKEVLPYPPLAWDIVSRPYHAYRSIPFIFKTPSVVNMAHERHFSLSDRIVDSDERFRFNQYPTADKQHTEREGGSEQGRKPQHYFFYDFFNLPWSSFLTYPHQGACVYDLAEYY